MAIESYEKKIMQLTEIEQQMADLIQTASDKNHDSCAALVADAERYRDAILTVLKNEKSTTDELRDALSLFIDSIVIYPDSRVLIRYTLPGLTKVVSKTRVSVSAPPEGVCGYSQLFEMWVVAG